MAAITPSDYIRPEGAWSLLEPVRDALLAADSQRVFDLSLPMFGDDYVSGQQEMMAMQKEWIVNLPEVWHRGVGKILVAVQAMDLREELPKVRCPVQVIAAAQDKIFPPEEGKILASAVRNGRFEVIAGAGHNLVVEKPQELAEVLVRFFSKTPLHPGGFL